MKTACFIIPYFGKLPNTFDIFLKTCEFNSEYDWLIITDDTYKYNYPKNVRVQYMKFEEFVAKVQRNFEFEISLKRPYKICDFRAAFGKIFEDELREYLFWGHCDLDQFFGKIDNFITTDILEAYDKILCLGHFTLFRNIPRINNLYLNEDQKLSQNYKAAFTDEKHWIFDEWPSANTSINKIAKQENISTYIRSDCFCDVLPFKSCFRRTIFDFAEEKWKADEVKSEVYIWKEGHSYRIWRSKNQIKKEEILYTHIRQRKMSVEQNGEYESFLIIPNKIICKERIEKRDIEKVLFTTKLRNLSKIDEIQRIFVLIKGYLFAVRQRIEKLNRSPKEIK